METWQTILLAIGGNTALIAVLAFLGKSFVEKILARDSKRFELDLKSKADAAIEQLKSQLQLQTIEHQVRFSRLHEKRATVIAELYGRLAETLWAVEGFLSPMEFVGEPPKQEKYATAMNKIAALYQFFDKNRIYFPAPLCESLEQFIQRIRLLAIELGVYLPHQGRGVPSEQQISTWHKNWEAIKSEVPHARQGLEDEFRALLGEPANPALQRTGASAGR